MENNETTKNEVRKAYANPVKEAGAFWRNVVIGHKRIENGKKIVERDLAKDYSLGKVILGTAIGVVGVAGVAAGTTYAVKKITGSGDDGVDVYELPEEVTNEETTEA